MLEGKAEENIDNLKPKMKTLDSIKDIPMEPYVIIMAKADGEFTKLHYRRNGETTTINRYGHWRTDFPALNELTQALDRTNVQEAEILVELYAVDASGYPLILPNFIHAIKGSDKSLLERVHIGVWDLVSVNGVPVTQDYEWKLDELKNWLRTAEGHRLERAYVLPHIIFPSRAEHDKSIRDFWNLWVKISGYEGVVVRTASDIYKIKPIRDVDAVIIALNKVDSTGHPTKRWVEEKVSSVRVALMDQKQTFIELGDCTIANPEIQSALWKLHDLKVSEDHERIYVKPLVIIQIQYTSAFEGSFCKRWKYHNQYVEAGSCAFFKLRNPRFMRFRSDKKVCPEDLRLEQIKDGE